MVLADSESDDVTTNEPLPATTFQNPPGVTIGMMSIKHPAVQVASVTVSVFPVVSLSLKGAGLSTYDGSYCLGCALEYPVPPTAIILF